MEMNRMDRPYVTDKAERVGIIAYGFVLVSVRSTQVGGSIESYL
ncbi:hypothetical protein Barb7_02175 [Bacteroidales bacterium Barb7]|nr:hypothetical protein Barb7_02175 [Bacteroidales bacterium Barb7]